MRGRTTCFMALVGAAFAAAFAASDARAQEAEVRETVLRSEHPSVPDAVLRPVSPFELRGLADQAFGGIRNRGNHLNRIANDGTINYTQGNPVGIIIFGTPLGARTPYFLADFVMGASPTDWQNAQAQAPSLANALGGGFNVAYNENTGFFARIRQWRPGDDQLGRVHSGVASTTDGTCTQHRNLGASNILMNINDCPPTWGSEQFAGAVKKTTLPQWVELFETTPDPNAFTWDWWQVPDSLVSDELMGDAQSYYTFTDYAADRLVRFGDVVPASACTGCGQGDPIETGWPMGITVKVDVFSFALPSVVDAAIYQMLIINDSEKVYGVGLDYDSLYVGNGHGVLFQNQSAGHYWLPQLGALLLNNQGINPGCNGALTGGGVAGCAFPNGQNNGGTAQVFLKSPIGDLRNKLFSDPESPFFAPGHPNAGDTITFNHGRRCSFGACWGPVMTRSERAEFGMIASQEQHVLDGRTETAFDAQANWFDVFSNFDFPTRTPAFTRFVPPEGWDYDKDGVPDTIRVNSCHVNGCVEVHSDTLPGKQNNASGNLTGFTTAGPFSLAAGDTTALTLAFVSGTTPVQALENTRAVISFYQNAFLGPQPPPAPRVVAVNTQPGDRGAVNTPPARVTIFIDDGVEEFEDPFLANVLGTLEGSQLDIDNPGLVDSLRLRISDNVDRILVFKSCDLGVSFTAAANCEGDPLVDENGTPINGGWQPYAVLEQADDGSFPNVFVDQAVTPGVTYLYSFVSVSKGFEPLVLERDNLGNLVPVVFDGGAPILRNPLSASSSDPNVVSVYVPASRETGGRDAQVVFTQEDDFFVSAFNPLLVTIAGSIDDGGEFSAFFGDSVVVTDDGTNVTVEVFRVVTTSPDGTVLENVVVDSETFTTTSARGVNILGGTTTTMDVMGTEVTTTTFTELTLVLVDDAGEPLFASSSLTGTGTTPGSFLGRPDFPLFLLDVDATEGGDFVSDNWFQPRADTLALLAGEPEVDWSEGNSQSANTLLGEYHLVWSGPDYGPAETFVPNLANPAATEAEVEASLLARTDAQSTSTSAEVAAALGVDQADLLDVDLPFTVTNVVTGEPVTVAMTSKLDSITIGRLTDQIRVAVPPGEWVPGDQMIFLETRTLPQTATATGGEEYIVVSGGQVQTTDALVVTFSSAVLGCAARLICNPVPANATGADVGGHLPVRAGQVLRVRYASEANATTRFAFEVVPTLRGDQITEVTAADVDRIRVVPNPYVVFSEYEQERNSQTSRLMFTNLPPQGDITIFTISGQIVQRISYTPEQLAGNGDLFWDMRTLENTDLAAGLYLFVVEGTLPASGASVRKLGKFVVIR